MSHLTIAWIFLTPMFSILMMAFLARMSGKGWDVKGQMFFEFVLFSVTWWGLYFLIK